MGRASRTYTGDGERKEPEIVSPTHTHTQAAYSFEFFCVVVWGCIPSVSRSLCVAPVNCAALADVFFCFVRGMFRISQKKKAMRWAPVLLCVSVRSFSFKYLPFFLLLLLFWKRWCECVIWVCACKCFFSPVFFSKFVLLPQDAWAV